MAESVVPAPGPEPRRLMTRPHDCPFPVCSCQMGGLPRCDLPAAPGPDSSDPKERTEQEIRTDLAVVQSPIGPTPTRSEIRRLLNDVPALLDANTALRAERDRANALSAEFNEAMEEARAEVTALRAEVERLRGGPIDLWHERDAARAEVARLRQAVEQGIHRLRHTAGRTADYTAEGVSIRINSDADFLAAALGGVPEDERRSDDALPSPPSAVDKPHQ